MAVITGKLTTSGVQWRRHGMSLSSDIQLWESRGTNRKTKEFIVFICGTAIHWQSSIYAFNLEEEMKRKMNRSFIDKAPDPTELRGAQGLGPVGPAWSWSGWCWPPWLPGREWLSPPWGELGWCDTICSKGMSSHGRHRVMIPSPVCPWGGGQPVNAGHAARAAWRGQWGVLRKHVKNKSKQSPVLNRKKFLPWTSDSSWERPQDADGCCKQPLLINKHLQSK